MAGTRSIGGMQITWIAAAVLLSGVLSWWAKRRSR
jgi:hypothetical protein